MARAFLLLALASLLLTSFPAAADDLTYSDIDRATVRVLALGPVDVEEVEHDKVKYPVAVPLAGHGSGVLVGGAGLILTAEHVVAESRAIAVMIPGYPKALPAVVVYENEDHDVALIRVLGNYTQVAKLADPADALAVRQTVFAIGYPLDARRTDPQSTQGIVSGKLPDGALQLGMTVNPGNSGGPVVDEAGLVRGIVIARSRLDEGAVGLAYAVPLSNIVGPVSQQENTPLSTERDAYLRTDAAQLSADLTTAMSQYGLEVLQASLSGGSLDLDPKLRKTLNKASYGEEASVDGRLMSAAMYWNQSLVQQARGKSVWRKSRAYAVKLAREAVKLEPRLKKESKFISVVLKSNPGDGRFQPGTDAPPSEGGGENMDSRSRFDTGPTDFPEPPPTPEKKGKANGGYLEGAYGYGLVSRSASESGSADYFSLATGYWRRIGEARLKIGAFYRRHGDTEFEVPCDEFADDCAKGVISVQTFGAQVALVPMKYVSFGLGMTLVDTEHTDGAGFEVDAGLRIPLGAAVDLNANALFMVADTNAMGGDMGLSVYF